MASLHDTGQSVWRIIIPDDKGYYPNDIRCNKDYKMQVR